jgi:chaperone LolA
MTRARNILAGLLCLLAFLPAVRLAAGDDAQDLLSRLQDRYKSVRDASVTFSQHVLFGVTKSETSFRGSFVMKKGNKYRLELEDQTIVTDGTSLWSYSKANNQVIINAYREDPKTFSPDKVLVSVPENYVGAILGTEVVRGKETTILKLTPKTKRSAVRWMKVWVVRGDDLMRRIQVYDASENTITYDLDDITLNSGVADSKFVFVPPPKADVIDLR